MNEADVAMNVATDECGYTKDLTKCNKCGQKLKTLPKENFTEVFEADYKGMEVDE